MKSVVKNLLIILLFLFSLDVCFSKNSQEVIFLDATEVSRLKIPSSQAIDGSISNQNHIMYTQKVTDDFTDCYDDDLTDNKVLRTFYKFVDEKLINNKMNEYTSSLIDSDEE